MNNSNHAITLNLHPPHATDIEQIVLGTILMNDKAMLEASQILQPEHFYAGAHQLLFEKMTWMDRHNRKIDLLTVVESLSADGMIGDKPGQLTPYYITRMTKDVNPYYVEARMIEHCLIILQYFVSREQMRIGVELYNRAGNKADFADTNDWLLSEQEKLWNHVLHVKFQSYQDLVFKHLQQIVKNDGTLPPGILTKFRSLDDIILGLMAGELVICAARPSMGKTAFMVQLTENISKEHPIGIVELESSDRAFVHRHLANKSGVSATHLKVGGLEEVHIQRIHDAAEDIYKQKIFCAFDPRQNIYSISTIIRSWVMKHKVKVVLIDYLQILNTTAGDERKNRERQVAEMTQTLAALAVSLDICIIAFAQLSREVLKRAGNRPNLGDLRESGGIEAAARQVWFIHRPEYYGETEDEFGNSLIGVTEIIVAKNNEGKLGTARLLFEGALSRFRDTADQLWMGPAAADTSSGPHRPMNLPGVDTDLWEKDTPF